MKRNRHVEKLSEITTKGLYPNPRGNRHQRRAHFAILFRCPAVSGALLARK